VNIDVCGLVQEARLGRGEDRISVIRKPHHTVFVVADGAGGCSGGTLAAEIVCGALDAGETDWSDWLTRCDRVIAGRGLAAAVVVSVSDDGFVSGASVGDCEAWLFDQGEPIAITADQVRKPLLGSGNACPTRFTGHLTGTLVVATDGLWKYANTKRLAAATRLRPLTSATNAMVNDLRLKSGTLPDDVAVVACVIT
jgi:hypothetical protein